MDYLWIILLGLGGAYLMSRGGLGMGGCCCGSHGDHHSGNSEPDYSQKRASRQTKGKVIDLGPEDYKVITSEHHELPQEEGAEHGEAKA